MKISVRDGWVLQLDTGMNCYANEANTDATLSRACIWYDRGAIEMLKQRFDAVDPKHAHTIMPVRITMEVCEHSAIVPNDSGKRIAGFLGELT
jgi:hypothetical protein